MGVEASQCDIAGMRLFEVSSGKSFQLLWRSTYGYNYFTGTKQDHSLLPPANEVCEGYVFTGVCLSTGGCLPRCLWADTPRQTPPGHPPLLPSACWDTPPCTVHAGIRSTSGRYASHWNAFLSFMKSSGSLFVVVHRIPTHTIWRTESFSFTE